MCEHSVDVRTFGAMRTSGRSRRGIDSDMRRGALVPVRRGVYASSSACPTALIAAAHGGSLACVTAARHVGIWVLENEPTVHVWLGAHGRRYDHPNCSCVSHWDDGVVTNAFGMPSVPRILRQIFFCRGMESFFVALESAIRQNLLTRAGRAWLRAHTNAAGREALDYAGRDADSGIESLLRWRLRRHRLEIRSQVHIISVGIVDFLLGDRLIVEVDGRANHADGDHRHKDLIRDANAAAWGYLVLRFDYAMIVHDWETVELAILRHIDLGRHLA